MTHSTRVLAQEACYGTNGRIWRANGGLTPDEGQRRRFELTVSVLVPVLRLGVGALTVRPHFARRHSRAARQTQRLAQLADLPERHGHGDHDRARRSPSRGVVIGVDEEECSPSRQERDSRRPRNPHRNTVSEIVPVSVRRPGSPEPGGWCLARM